MMPQSPAAAVGTRVLVLVEEATWGEVLVDALSAAGLCATLALDDDGLAVALAGEAPGAVLVDTDTQPLPLGHRWLAAVRARWPSVRVVALVACGGALDGTPPPSCHATVEKPARLRTLVEAVTGAADAAR